MITQVSVIVPTHNRAAMLAEHLRALTQQTCPRSSVEVIVVCDGCSDRSADVARDAGADRVIEQAGAGAGAARNAGLAVAAGPLVLFLDDDIVPTPGWVQAYVNSVESNEGKVLYMGYCPYSPAAIKSHLDQRNAAWYEAKLKPLRNPDHAWTFTDFFGGNFAAHRDQLRSLGGFDPRFELFEDAELALRALCQGWTVRFISGATAYHHAHREVREYGRQAYRSGRVDAFFATLHPEARGRLRLGLRRPLPKQLVGAAWRALALRTAGGIELVERAAEIAEQFRLRRVLDLFYPLIWDGQYWRGVEAA